MTGVRQGCKVVTLKVHRLGMGQDTGDTFRVGAHKNVPKERVSNRCNITRHG
ncbi:MAG: hypothetical protein HXS52_10375 [Theionarchaea archaeon]|nr:hypothetical protein [Theionarchaea archaeon]MBU7038327.1 hypothetical protein [Theionarchaea archaeon]